MQSMLKRIFKSLDKVGVAVFIVGCLTLVLSCFLAYGFVSFRLHIFGILTLYFGVKFTFSFFVTAVYGSLYRQRTGKNKDLYLANKERLDKRFEKMFAEDYKAEVAEYDIEDAEYIEAIDEDIENTEYIEAVDEDNENDK